MIVHDTSSRAHIPGIACPCGCTDLVVLAPGSDAQRETLFDLPQVPIAGRGWCSIEHAQLDGWPWVETETPHGERRAA